jgi:hypothetical protein
MLPEKIAPCLHLGHLQDKTASNLDMGFIYPRTKYPILNGLDTTKVKSWLIRFYDPDHNLAFPGHIRVKSWFKVHITV